MSAKSNSKKGNWQIKRINSKSGPLNGTVMSEAIRKSESISGESKILWSAREGQGNECIAVPYSTILHMIMYIQHWDDD